MKVVPEPLASPEEQATRRRVMKYVMGHGWTTATVLAEEFDLTPAAIRRHLGHLEATGMLVVRTQPQSRRSGVGRPSKEYSATTEGRAAFGHAYDLLAIGALDALGKIGGDGAVTGFFESRFADVESRFADLLAATPDLDPAVALSRALTQAGFAAGLLPLGGGEQLCQHHCPYTAVAARFPQLCSVETSVFSRLLDSHVQRLATIAHGDGVCTTYIPSAHTSRKGDR